MAKDTRNDAPNDASARSKAEGDRWSSDSETVERYDETIGETVGDEGGGITNRPLGEEYEQPAEEDPVMPSEDSSLNTKI
jgi:hypothetical protein